MCHIVISIEGKLMYFKEANNTNIFYGFLIFLNNHWQ